MEWFEQEWRGGKEENHEYILEKLSNKCARGGKKKKRKKITTFPKHTKKKKFTTTQIHIHAHQNGIKMCLIKCPVSNMGAGTSY